MSRIKSTDRQTIYFVLILLLAACLRIWGLNSRSIWLDEAIEYWTANVPRSEIFLSVATTIHDPPFYTLFLHYWLKFGGSALWLRLPALFTSLIGLAGIMRLSCKFYNCRVGVIAGLFFAVSSAEIRYAQEVGQYSLMVCLVVWNLYFLLSALRDNKWRNWIGWGLTASLGLYTHYGLVIASATMAASAFIYLLVQRKWPILIRLLVSGIAVIVSVVPIVLLIIPTQLNRLGAASQPFFGYEIINTTMRMLVFQVAGNSPLSEWPYPQAETITVAIILFLLLGVALTRSRNALAVPFLLLIVWIGYYLVSRTGSYFYLASRHSLFLLPLIAISFGLGVIALNNRFRYSGTILMLLIFLFALIVPREKQEDLRSAHAFWQENRQTGEQTYVYYGANWGFMYLLDQEGLIACGGRPISESRFNCADIANQDIYLGAWTRGNDQEKRRLDILDRLVNNPEKIWLIFSHIHKDEDVLTLTALAPQYEVIQRAEYQNGAAYQLQLRDQ